MNKNTQKILPIIFSIVAVIISIRSCQLSKKSLELSQQEYYDKFKTIWNFEYNEDGKVFKIKASNDKVNLQGARVFYPDSISNHIWNIRLPNNLLYVSSPIGELEKEISKKIKPVDSIFKLLDNSFAPIVLESYYTVDGENFSNLSLYALRYNANIISGKYSKPKVNITGLTYVNEIDPNTNIKDFLNQAWEYKMAELDSMNK